MIRRYLEWLQKATAGDNAMAEYALALGYLNGEFGLKQDMQAAVSLMRKAAEHTGDSAPDAQKYLGNVLRTRPASPQSRATAEMWYARAAAGFESMTRAGNIRARLALATMYEHGQGVKADARKADELRQSVVGDYTSAAEKGNAEAQAKLGDLYQKGVGVSRDPVEAMMWFRRAADQGDASAMMKLSGCYMMLGMPKEVFNGYGASDPENAVQSYVWLKLAITYGPFSAIPGERDTTARQFSTLNDVQSQSGRADQSVGGRSRKLMQTARDQSTSAQNRRELDRVGLIWRRRLPRSEGLRP